MDKVIEYNYEMTCGSAEAEKRRYTKHECKDGHGFWLVADQPNAGDNVYYYSGDPKSQGFGGRELRFTLTDETVLNLVGPWHGNTDSLFESTGYDIRDKHLTYVVIAKERETNKRGESIYKDVLFMDTEPVIGNFDRGEILAKALANKLGRRVFCYSRSSGGSSCCPVNPDKEHERLTDG